MPPRPSRLGPRWASANFWLAAVAIAACAAAPAWGDAYDPPANYYSSAAGTGATLKSNLHNIIDNHTVISYSGATTALAVTDVDPNDASNLLTVYDRTSINKQY